MFNQIVQAGGAFFGSYGSVLTGIFVVLLLIFVRRRLFKFLKPLIGSFTRRFQRDPIRRQIFAAYRREQRRIRSYRTPAQTVREHALANPELAHLVEIVEIAAYKPGAVDKGLL